MTLDEVAALAIAALGGAAIGLERQASGHADGPRARFAGIRTFTMLGVLGGVAGVLIRQGSPLAAGALLLGGAALVVAAYVAASRIDVDGTTEVAALVVLAAGTLSGLGDTTTGSALIAATGLLLVEKTRLHALAARIDNADLRAGLRFAAMALVILPLLPAGPFGPGVGVRPRELWALVLFFSGLSFAGHVAQRAAGPRHGLVVAGALGGMVSSTNVTLTFARGSHDEATKARALGVGALAANLVLYPRVLLATTVMSPQLASVLWPFLVGPLVVAAAWTGWGAWRLPNRATPEAVTSNPLKVAAALQMAVLFQVVLYAVAAARQWWGQTGLLASGAVLGLTDVDALTVTMARGTGVDAGVALAARAIAVGVLANTALKLTVALLIGGGGFRRVAAPGLAAMALASAAALAWFGLG